MFADSLHAYFPLYFPESIKSGDAQLPSGFVHDNGSNLLHISYFGEDVAFPGAKGIVPDGDRGFLEGDNECPPSEGDNELGYHLQVPGA